MKWLLLSLVAIIGLASAETFTLQNYPIEVEADTNTRAEFVSSPYFAINVSWGAGRSFLIRPIFETTNYGNLTYENIRIRYPAFLGRTVIRREGRIKWAFNFTIPAAAASRLTSIYLSIEDANFNWREVQIEDMKLHFPGMMAMDFSDLSEMGWQFQFTNRTMIRITGVTNNLSINLDPQIIVWSIQDKSIYDSYMSDFGADAKSNFGASGNIVIGKIPISPPLYYYTHGIISYNVTKYLPPSANVTSVCLYFGSPVADSGFRINIERVMKLWYEGNADGTEITSGPCGVTWNSTCWNSTSADNWTDKTWHLSRGGDSSADVYWSNLTSYTFTGDGSSVQICDTGGNLTDLVQQWVNLTEDWRKGLMILNETPSFSAYLPSSESTTLTDRPRLIINATLNYSIEPTFTSTAPNSPFGINLHYRTGVDGNEIFGGRFIFKSLDNKLGRKTFRFGRFDTSSNNNSFYSGGDHSISNVNGSLFYYANGTNMSNAQTSGQQYESATIDVNGDGIDEIATGHSIANRGVLKFKNGTNIWTSDETNIYTVTIADVNQDGVLDILMGSAQGNLTAYNGTLTKTILWSIGNLNGTANARLCSIFEVAVQDMYAGTASANREIGIAWGRGTSGTVQNGMAVYNASNGAFLYRFTQTTINGGTSSIIPIDCNKVGYYNCWASVNGNRLITFMNVSAGKMGTMTSGASVSARSIYQLVSGDLDGDGFNNEWITYSNLYLMAYKMNASNSSNLYMNLSVPYTSSNSSGTSPSSVSEAYNNLIWADIDGNGFKEIMMAEPGGHIYILNNATNQFIEYLDSGFITDYDFGTSPSMHYGTNTSDNSTVIGWGTASGEEPTNNNRTYVFEYEPCKISINGNPLKTLKWNPNLNSYYYGNSSGLPAGSYFYNISCDGNFSGFGQKTYNGTIEFVTPSMTANGTYPLNESYNMTDGWTQFSCNVTAAGVMVKNVSFNFEKYYAGWNIHEPYNITILENQDILGNSLVNLSVNLSHGFYRWNCTVTNTTGGFNYSDDLRYKTGNGTVYIQNAIHTENNANDFTHFPPTVSFSYFNRGLTGYVDTSMAKASRYQYNDSYDHPFTIVWKLRMDENLCESNKGCNGTINAMFANISDNSYANYSQNISYWGDSLGWHVHFVEWYDYSNWDAGDGLTDNRGGDCDGGDCQPATNWNQQFSMNGTRYRNQTDIQIGEKILSIFIIDTGIYPISAVTGWLGVTTDISNFYANYTPFNYDNHVGEDSHAGFTEPVQNIDNWSVASADAYHPSFNDYQLQGDNKNIIMQCANGGLNDDASEKGMVDHAFNLAANGTDMILCNYFHSYSANALLNDLYTLHDQIENSMAPCTSSSSICMETRYPNVKYVYTNGTDMVQKTFGKTDIIAPIILLTKTGDIVNVTSSESMWNIPILAYKNSSNYYGLIRLAELNATSWSANVSGVNVATLRAAGIDTSYNEGYSDYVVEPELTITYPTTESPITVSFPQNITVNFTLTNASSTELITGVEVLNITIVNSSSTMNCTNLTSLQYTGGNWTVNCSIPYLSIGSYDLTVIANHSTTDLVSGTETTAIGVGILSISFTVLTLGGGGNSTNSMATSPGNSTEAYYFNASSMYQQLVRPCANPDATTNCQNGPNTPMYEVINTGGSTFDFYMRINTDFTGQGIKLCANSTGTAGATNTVATCDLSGVGNLNTTWVRFGTIGINDRLNITEYANFSYVYGGIYARTQYLNST